MAIKSLKEPVSATAVYKKGACHIMYGKVRLSAAPAPSFSFTSEASWPRESCENAVRRGIADALAEAGVGTEFGAKFMLEEIDWHEVDSCERGYREAARQATQEILRTAGIVNTR